MREIEFKLTVEEGDLLLEALGQMPFVRVYGLVAKIQRQAGPQLRDDGSASASPAGAEAGDGGAGSTAAETIEALEGADAV